MTKSETTAELASRRQYGRELFGAIAVYTVLLVAALPIVKHLDKGPVRYLIVEVPMVGFVLGVVAVYRAIQRADEYQRELYLRTLALCFGLTAAITFGYGFLEIVGAPRVSMFSVWPLMALLWIVVSLFLRRTAPR